jgi:hypothetical protein
LGRFIFDKSTYHYGARKNEELARGIPEDNHSLSSAQRCFLHEVKRKIINGCTKIFCNFSAMSLDYMSKGKHVERRN